MKKLFLGLIATVLLSNFSYGQKKVTLNSIVTAEEFKAMDPLDRKIVNYIDAGIFALKGLNLNGEQKAKHVVTINIDTKSGALENNIVLAEPEANSPFGTDLSSVQSCTICGVGSGMICFRMIKSRLSNGPLIVQLELISDCITVSWN